MHKIESEWDYELIKCSSLSVLVSPNCSFSQPINSFQPLMSFPGLPHYRVSLFVFGALVSFSLLVSLLLSEVTFPESCHVSCFMSWWTLVVFVCFPLNPFFGRVGVIYWVLWAFHVPFLLSLIINIIYLSLFLLPCLVVQLPCIHMISIKEPSTLNIQ